MTILEHVCMFSECLALLRTAVQICEIPTKYTARMAERNFEGGGGQA